MPNKVVKVACSFFHTMALTNDGRIFTWGGTLYGKSGIDEKAKKKDVKYVPREIIFFRDQGLIVTQIACG